MIWSQRFVEGVLWKPEFGARCLSIFIDKAHCCSHWGADFWKKYGSIGIIWGFLSCLTPLITVTTTLMPWVHKDLFLKLQFNPPGYLFVNISNDHSNVSQIVHAMEHPIMMILQVVQTSVIASVHEWKRSIGTLAHAVSNMMILFHILTLVRLIHPWNCKGHWINLSLEFQVVLVLYI